MKNTEKSYEQLTFKQQAFVDYYIETRNCTESAKRAGYSEKTAYAKGQELYKQLKHLIRPRIEEIAGRRVMGVNEILAKLTAIAMGEEKDAFGLDVSNQDKIKALELLGKSYQIYTDKVKTDLDMDINVNLVDEGDDK